MADDRTVPERLPLLAESDADGYCDAATGACALPPLAAAPPASEKPMSQVPSSAAHSTSEPTGVPVTDRPESVPTAE